jgi:hypothetical protein
LEFSARRIPSDWHRRGEPLHHRKLRCSQRVTSGFPLIVMMIGSLFGWEDKLELPHETCWSATDHSL